MTGRLRSNDVLIADDAGNALLGETFAHDETGITALCDALVCFEVEVVAIERPDGVLVERLLKAGVQVLARATPRSELLAVAVQGDGKLALAGGATDASGNEQLLVARVNADGSVDSSFAAGGKLLVQLGWARARSRKCARSRCRATASSCSPATRREPRGCSSQA